jgi:hypothetical protein
MLLVPKGLFFFLKMSTARRGPLAALHKGDRPYPAIANFCKNAACSGLAKSSRKTVKT